MGDGLTFRLQQSLHGYSDGHRRLAGSEVLGTRDSRLVQALSDVAGPGLRIPRDGYLTGYPLREVPFYVLARTWAAPEMARPGCVWTHSLYIPFADLSRIGNSLSVAALFRRPEAAEFGAYQEKLDVEPLMIAHRPLQQGWLRAVIWSLYSRPSAKLVVRSKETEAVDEDLLAIWDQQWTSLRSRFRFCSAATTDRSGAETPFDIQVSLEAERGTRTRFGDVTEVTAPSDEPISWLQLALDDLGPRRSDDLLHAFLEEVGNADRLGREAFAGLLELFSLLPRAATSISASLRSRALVADKSSGLDRSSLARAAVVRVTAEGTDEVVLHGASFLMENLPQFAGATDATKHRLAALLWSHDPANFERLLNDHGLRSIAELAVASLPPAEVLGTLSVQPTLLEFAIRARPDLLDEPSLWGNAVLVKLLLSIFQGDDDMARRGLAAAIEQNKSERASDLVEALGAEKVLRALAESSHEPNATDPWVAASVTDVTGVGRFLRGCRKGDRGVALAVARATSPDMLQGGKRDPWVAVASQIGADDHYFLAFLFARALGGHSTDQVDLCRLSFELLHDITARSKLSDEAWSLLEHRLPTSEYWFDWDRCMRLRGALVDLFVLGNLPPEAFLDVVESDQLFGALSMQAMYDPRGRKYLGRARRAVGASQSSSSRARLLDRLVD